MTMTCNDETTPKLSDGRCGVCGRCVCSGPGPWRETYDFGRLQHDANFWMQEAEQARAERDALKAELHEHDQVAIERSERD